MNYEEVRAQARKATSPLCQACPVCDGVSCRNRMPGPGAKGDGLGAIRNYQGWQKYAVNTDLIYAGTAIDTTTSFWGQDFAFPILAGPVGAVKLHYGPLYDDVTYNQLLVSGCAAVGIAAMTGDGNYADVMTAACQAIKANNGRGIPTIKPWDMETVKQKMAQVNDSGSMAVAMDIDAAGLPFLKGRRPQAGPKTIEELTQIVSLTDKPFILKGVMTVAGALKAVKAGVSGIIVSNHGGRVQDSVPATAQVLPEIAQALKGSGVKVLVDGGLRSGVDIFKALALGADGVVIARPFVTAVYGGGQQGIECLLDLLGSQLADTMLMCSANRLSDICPEMITRL
jgi:4-hydroxymandelate oxidase